MKVQAMTKTKSKEDSIKAVAKIVEALDEICSHEQEKILVAALLLAGNRDLALRLIKPNPFEDEVL